MCHLYEFLRGIPLEIGGISGGQSPPKSILCPLYPTPYHSLNIIVALKITKMHARWTRTQGKKGKIIDIWECLGTSRAAMRIEYAGTEPRGNQVLAIKTLGY